MSAVVRLSGVSKRFILRHERARSFQDAVVNFFHRRNGSHEEFWALRDVSFEVGEGETLGVIGRNGSGKSTILKLVARILEPTEGTIDVKGRLSALIELGAGFHPDLTGRENVYLNGSILGLSRKQIRQKLDDIVAFAELERFIDTPVKHYSSGMYARLGFSVAISVEPDVLLIDEVLSVGDEAFQQKCIGRIQECRAQGVSIVFVSHSLDSVRSLCDRVIWLDAGRIRLDGDASTVVDGYLASSSAGGRPRPGLGGEVAGTPGDRWGSGEVEITEVTLLDGEGRQKRGFAPGETLVVRMHYRAATEVPDPTFGIAIYLHDGTHLTGPNTRAGGCLIPSVSGEGWVDYVVEDLPLAHGVYDLSVAVYDRTGSHAFDHHHRLYRFEVYRSSPLDTSTRGEYGLVRIPATWRHVPAGSKVSPWK